MQVGVFPIENAGGGLVRGGRGWSWAWGTGA